MFRDKLENDNLWFEYLESKLEKDYVSKKEKEEIKDFVENKKYKNIVSQIISGSYTISTPEKHLINKNHGKKKRIVYTYTDEEMHLFKYISFLLYDYDYLFSKNLYSFRRKISVKDAVKSLMHVKNIRNMMGYKVDIKNYFNSINPSLLLKNLKKDITDPLLFSIFEQVLTNPYTIYNGDKIKEAKGVVAGSPLSAFLANYYLREVDDYFSKEKVFYIRYADDIIVFANTKEEVEHYRDTLYDFLEKYHLKVNHNKEHFYDKGETFEFLGFSFSGREVDLSENTIYKMKGKIRRTCRGVRRWMIRNNVDYKIALKAINRRYNNKFYGNDNSELSWRYWFFPTINTIQGLKTVDQYFQDELRYVVTGKHNKKNYKIVPYSVLKECHYRPLVHEYYELITNVENHL